jgi:hypothetical protein
MTEQHGNHKDVSFVSSEIDPDDEAMTISFRTPHRRPATVVRRRRGIHQHHVVSGPRPSDQVLDALGPIHDLHR